MDKISWTQIITAIVAVYGAILSTVTFYMNRKEKIRTLKVSFSNGFLTFDNGSISEGMLFINVANPGFKKVVVNIP